MSSFFDVDKDVLSTTLKIRPNWPLKTEFFYIMIVDALEALFNSILGVDS